MLDRFETQGVDELHDARNGCLAGPRQFGSDQRDASDRVRPAWSRLGERVGSRVGVRRQWFSSAS
jgi:hypothetical protein